MGGAVLVHRRDRIATPTIEALPFMRCYFDDFGNVIVSAVPSGSPCKRESRRLAAEGTERVFA